MATKKASKKQEKLEAQVRKARREAVDAILELMNEKDLKWVCEWEKVAFMPRNGKTNRPYHGGNRVYLAAAAIRAGFEDPRWFTYKQAKEEGYYPKKGVHGCKVEYWRAWSYVSETENDEGETEQVTRRYLKLMGTYTLFNAEQLVNDDGQPYPKEAPMKKVRLNAAKCEIANRMIDSSRCAVHELKREVRAYYSLTSDHIHIPARQNFRSMNAFIGTLAHEMAHSTMKPLCRPVESYAFEELVAELASVFVCMHLGIERNATLEKDENFANHAAYLKSWLHHMGDNPDYLFKAMHKADEAADCIIERYDERIEKAA